MFGYPVNELAEYLCDEIISFMQDESNNDSYKIKIWEIPDNSMILQTLIPQFEEYDESVLKEHLFFK